MPLEKGFVCFLEKKADLSFLIVREHLAACRHPQHWFRDAGCCCWVCSMLCPRNAATDLLGHPGLEPGDHDGEGQLQHLSSRYSLDCPNNL